MGTGSALDDDSDRLLVERTQRGDLRAFDLLVLKYQSRVMHVVMRFVRDADEAEDVAQEAFIKAYSAINNFRGDSAFYTWLFRIATNAAKNHLVARGRRTPVLDVDIDDALMHDENQRLVEDESPQAALETQELEAVIKRAVQDLPDELQTALCLREFDGLSYEDIAVIMNCPIGTVRSRIFRGRETVDQKVAALLNGEPI
ncbi:MAG: polymerase sigma factor RpoE [Pseudomonadota bacterium]